jgi:hypothetical protein
MFQLKKAENRIVALAPHNFSTLGFSERQHLQEWLANCPEALGEELLIIQKEFDGFNETRERLDLLAIDQGGGLVIIENKLDDSGRDVVWQALKYASYCFSLSKADIINIFQSYLDKTSPNSNATEILCDFLQKPDIEEVSLNKGTKQRIMLVAANFRKEVTSTVLWLLNYQIDIQCFKVTPYASGDQLFLNIDQIIPMPEAKEMMIGFSIKEAEEKSVEASLKERHIVRLKFWEQALDAFKLSPLSLFNNISPTKDSWLNARTGIGNVSYTLILNKDEARVEVYMSRSTAEENKFIFDWLYQRREAIENEFGSPLVWERLDARKACRIKFSKDFDTHDEKYWPEITKWMVDHMILLEKAFKKPLAEINEQLH